MKGWSLLIHYLRYSSIFTTQKKTRNLHVKSRQRWIHILWLLLIITFTGDKLCSVNTRWIRESRLILYDVCSKHVAKLVIPFYWRRSGVSETRRKTRCGNVMFLNWSEVPRRSDLFSIVLLVIKSWQSRMPFAIQYLWRRKKYIMKGGGKMTKIHL